jgi:FtsP/CotA-like multicopper oxidase with cupredoxin domain
LNASLASTRLSRLRPDFPRIVGTLWFALVCSCGRGPATPTVPNGGATGQPEGWDRELATVAPDDLNPDPHVLEINLEAAPMTRELVAGIPATVWAYNGHIPGPTLRAQVGDRVIVHFTNHLPEATTIHWHGIRLDAAMDGTPSVQPPVEPGASFDYDFVVPDAGLYWYHPHIRSNAQVDSGLYGAIVVDDPAEGGDFGDPLLLVLSDIQVGLDGQLPGPDPNDIITAIFGREGNTVWVNGRLTPTVYARRGRRQRWRIVNAATSRYFWMDLAGHSFTRIGGDRGLIESPITGDTLLLAPGQRADVLVTPDAPVGTRLPVRWVAFDRGFGTAIGRPPIDIFYVQIAAEAIGPAPPEVPAVLRAIEPLDLRETTAQELTLAPLGVGYGINGVAFGSPMAEPLHATVGATDIWTVSNQSNFDHPVHLHGFFFQELENDSLEPRRPLEWRDTVNVPQWSDVTFAVKYDDRPGTWMFHCHILDHAEVGMMTMLEVAR